MEVTKVIVEVQLDFSEESDEALRTLFAVAEELLDKHNIWVEIIPTHIWFVDPVQAEMSDFPKIFINGKLRFVGRTPSKKELKQAILEYAGLPPKPAEVSSNVFAKVNFDGGTPEASLIM